MLERSSGNLPNVPNCNHRDFSGGLDWHANDPRRAKSLHCPWLEHILHEEARSNDRQRNSQGPRLLFDLHFRVKVRDPSRPSYLPSPTDRAEDHMRGLDSLCGFERHRARPNLSLDIGRLPPGDSEGGRDDKETVGTLKGGFQALRVVQASLSPSDPAVQSFGLLRKITAETADTEPAFQKALSHRPALLSSGSCDKNHLLGICLGGLRCHWITPIPLSISIAPTGGRFITTSLR